MATPVTREEFDELAEEVVGEKTVTRHILEQTRRNSDDLAALRTRTKRIEEKVDGLERRFDGQETRLEGLEGKVDGLDRKFNDFVRGFPAIVRDTMREVLRERDGRPDAPLAGRRLASAVRAQPDHPLRAGGGVNPP